ncbi:MAG: polya polymerase, partial [Deltaproteobacteria bacterium]|nr:polya polymerase [Deltaproteobacteria bacterium]
TCGIFPALHPSLNFSPKTVELVEAVVSVLSWWRYLFINDKIESWCTYLLALTDHLSDTEFQDVVRRLSIVRSKKKELFVGRGQAARVLSLFARGLLTVPHEIVDALRDFSIEVLLFMMAKTGREETRKTISLYITNLRHVRPLLTGKDLVQMGYEQGPIFGSILRELKRARLDGLVTTVQDERELVRNRFPLATRPGDPQSG